MVVFFVKSNENTYPKGRALKQIYRVVPITKGRKSTLKVWLLGRTHVFDINTAAQAILIFLIAVFFPVFYILVQYQFNVLTLPRYFFPLTEAISTSIK
mgnify:FL=1